MPSVEAFDLTTPLVVWRKAGEDGFNEPIVGLPEQYMGRWTRTNTDALDAKGTRIGVRIQAAFGCPVPLGSLVWPGRLNDLTGTGTPEQPAGDDLYQLSEDVTTYDVKGRARRFAYTVVRANKTLAVVTGG